MADTRDIPAVWDHETDVVIVGYGYAGGIAAIEARDCGADVLVLEKMPLPGGISICSGGGVRVATNAESAFSYLKATSGGLTPDNVLRAMAQGMTEILPYMERLAKANGAGILNIPYIGNYPFPGYEDLGFIMFGDLSGFDQFTYYPHARGLRGGARHFKVIEDNIKQRGIPVFLNTAVERLITASDRRVIGVAASRDGGRLNIKARRGVILACGGFEAAEDLKRQFLEGAPFLTAAFRGNTGDGIRMAQEVGAPLWHMWNIHGCYGFRHPDGYPFGIRLTRLPDWVPGHPLRPASEMAWIVVDQTARRYMNEFPPYLQDTGHRPMQFFDPATQSFPRIPSHLIFDEDGRKLYPLAIPSFNDPEVFFEWSKDNLAELELGILSRADSIEGMARALKVAPPTLRETIEQWNALCERGEDTDFGRPRETMRPIRTPPYYYAEVWPVVSNTQGGPVHNEHWQVLGAFGQPIPALYEAGELGGIWGYLYLAGGNLAECYVGGWTAARHAAGNEPWSGS